MAGLLVLGQVVDIDAFWYRRTDLGWIGLVSRDCSLCLLQQAFCVSGMLEADVGCLLVGHFEC